MVELMLAVLVGLSAAAGAAYVRPPGTALPSRAAAAGQARTPDAAVVVYNCALFAAMLTGIFAKYFWDRGFTAPIDVNGLWKPVLVAPIVFLPVYVAATKQPRGLVPMLIAFQNGFFWQTILESSGAVASAGS